MKGVNPVAFTILVVLFLVVTLVGFAAARWRRAEDKLPRRFMPDERAWSSP
jgi:hypothetical protein